MLPPPNVVAKRVVGVSREAQKTGTVLRGALRVGDSPLAANVEADAEVQADEEEHFEFFAQRFGAID